MISEGPGDPETTPRRPPESRNGAPGTAQNRSGADSGNSGPGGDLRENAGTRPEAKNKKKSEKGAPGLLKF